MTTSSPAPRSAVAQAIALLSHYGFDTKPYTAAESVGHLLEHYDANWIRFAIIEALYQGRYKAVSVEHILSMWARRGQPSQHFNGDFERIICRKLPAWFSTFALAEEPDVAESPETNWVAPPPQLPLIVRDDRALQTARHQRRVRCQGIERWRLIAKLGTTTYEEEFIARLKAIATITPEQLQAEISPVITPEMLNSAELPEPETVEDESKAAQEPMVTDEPEPVSAAVEEPPQTEIVPTDSEQNKQDEPNSAAIIPAPQVAEAVAVIDPVVEPELVPVETTTIADIETSDNIEEEVSKSRQEPSLTIATAELATFYSGIRTFMPSLRISPFFTRLKEFRATITQPQLTSTAPEPAIAPPEIAPPETEAIAFSETAPAPTESDDPVEPQPPAAIPVASVQPEVTDETSLPIASADVATDTTWDNEPSVVRLHS